MKTFLHIFISIMASVMIIVIGHSCGRHPDSRTEVQSEPTCSDTIALVSTPFDSIFEREGMTIEIRLMCEQDLWLNTRELDINTPLLRDLVDMYNASTAIRSIFTDFDLSMRNQDFSSDAKAAIKAFDLSAITNQEIRKAIQEYQHKMLALFDIDPSKVNQEEDNSYQYRDEADVFISNNYLITQYCDLGIDELTTLLNDDFWNNTDVPDWDTLQAKRGDVTIEPELRHRYLQSQKTDEQCIYLMELSHVHVAARYGNQGPYPGLMYDMLTSGRYSKYLYHLWTHWRCMCQYELGSSKDSYIPNWIYNQVRNQCAYSMLAYIAQHPSDIMAVTIFMQLALEQNVYREGPYPHGNQNTIDFYCLFHEQFENGDDEE